MLLGSKIVTAIFISSAFFIHMDGKESEKRKPPKFRESSDPGDVKFYLYRNPDNEDDVREIETYNYASLITSGYNPRWPLALLIHGALSDSLTFPDVVTIKNEYLRARYPLNVVMVDYGALIESLLPPGLTWLSWLAVLEAKNTTKIVAERITDLVDFLMLSGSLYGPEKVHLIGFSLGSNIAGGAGKYIQLRTGRVVKRISALDNPVNFHSQPKLAWTDADFIDVTYSSMGYRAKFKTVGHVQFFMNGGKRQLNCPNLFPFTQPYCNHFAAVHYFAKSIRRKVPIMACRCDTDDCKTMPDFCEDPVPYGHLVPYYARGDYYVDIS